jgi:WD40 repeat protein
VTATAVDWVVTRHEDKGLARYAIPTTSQRIDLGVARQDLLATPRGPERVAQAIYEALAKLRINYALEPHDGDPRVQRVRRPEVILGGAREGTCLDLALLFAGIALGNDLVPLLVVLNGHAIVAISMNDDRRTAGEMPRRNREGEWLNEGVIRKKDDLVALLDADSYVAIECTGFAFGTIFEPEAPEARGRVDGRLNFERAKHAGRQQLDAREMLFALDIAVLRDQQNFTEATAPEPEEAAPLKARKRTARMPDKLFFGRDAEQKRLDAWGREEACRCIVITGAAGMGKSSLAAHHIRNVAGQWDFVLWLEMRESPQPALVFEELSQFLSDGREPPVKESDLRKSRERILDLLTTRRALIAFDNLESVMNLVSGTWLAGQEELGLLIDGVTSRRHRSLLILTSQQIPSGLTVGDSFPVRHLPLKKGLELEASKMLMESANVLIKGTSESWNRTISHYAGNPRALEIVARGVHHNVNDSLEDLVELIDGGGLPFRLDAFDAFLDRQFKRIDQEDPNARTVLFWLAIAREPVAQQSLFARFGEHQKSLGKSLAGLTSLAIVEETSTGWTLGSQMMTFTTDLLVRQLADELKRGVLELLKNHGLLWTDSREYVRDAQRRVLLRPLLQATYGRSSAADALRDLLASHGGRPEPNSDYAAGNLLNLIIEDKMRRGTGQVELNGYNLVDATLKGVDLDQVAIRGTNLSGATLEACILPEAMGCVFSLCCGAEEVVAAGDGLGQIHLWDVRTLRRRASLRLPESGWVWSLALSPDGRSLVSGHADATVRVWELGSGAEDSEARVRAFDCRPFDAGSLGHRDGAVRGVAFVPNSNLVATGGGDGRILVWNLATRSLSYELERAHCGPVWSLVAGTCSAGAPFLISAGDDCAVRKWDLVTREHRIIGKHRLRVQTVALSSDGRFAATGGQDSTINIWNLGSEVLLSIPSHHGWIWSLAFSPDNKWLASCGEDQKVRIWDVATGECARTFVGHTHAVRAVRFASQSRLVSGSYDQTVKVWKTEGESNTASCVRTWRGQANQLRAVAFDPNGGRLASGGSDGIVRLHDLARDRTQSARGHTSFVWGVRFTSDGQGIVTVSDDETIRLWSASGDAVLPMPQPVVPFGSRVRSVDLDNAGRIAAGGCDGDNLIRIFKRSFGDGDWTLAKRLSGHDNWVWSVAFHPKGEFLASGSEDETIALWQLGSGECMDRVRVPNCRIHSVHFHPTKNLLASGGSDGALRLWSVQNGKLIPLVENRAHSDWIWSVCFSPNGRRLATAGSDRAIRLWSCTPKSTRLLHTAPPGVAHRNWVRTLAFDRTGKLVASAGDDEVIKIWNISTGKLVQQKEITMPKAWDDTVVDGVLGLTPAELEALMRLGAQIGATGPRSSWAECNGFPMGGEPPSITSQG